MSEKAEKKTLVEEGTEFVGTLRAKCPVVVKGSVEGELSAPAVAVTSTGQITGNVKADRVRSEGVLAGSVEADEISLAGEVKSNTVIRARSLEVKLGSDRGRLEVTFGDCVLDVGDMPAAEATDDDRPADEEIAAMGDDKSKRRKKGKRDDEQPEERPDAPAVLEAHAPESLLPV
jgi:cytoskeletal protein CcmA (bactofilin family)